MVCSLNKTVMSPSEPVLLLLLDLTIYHTRIISYIVLVAADLEERLLKVRPVVWSHGLFTSSILVKFISPSGFQLLEISTRYTLIMTTPRTSFFMARSMSGRFRIIFIKDISAHVSVSVLIREYRGLFSNLFSLCRWI